MTSGNSSSTSVVRSGAKGPSAVTAHRYLRVLDCVIVAAIDTDSLDIEPRNEPQACGSTDCVVPRLQVQLLQPLLHFHMLAGPVPLPQHHRYREGQ